MESYSAAVAVDPGSGATVVTVTGRMTIEHAADIKESLVGALDAAASVLLDLGGVSEVDLTGLQFVCALHRSAFAAGKGLVVRGLDTPLLKETMQRAGFDHTTRCPREACASCAWKGGREG